MPAFEDVSDMETAMTSLSSNRASTLWIMLLTVATTLSTLALACMTPFASLAAVAAVHMRRRDGVLVMLSTWLVNQAIGFGLMHYGGDPSTIAWGFGIGAATVAAVLSGGAAAARVVAYPAKLAVAFVAAFVAFKAVLALCALGLGGIEETLAFRYTGPQIVREALFVVGLVALYRGLLALGVPAARAPRALTA